MTRKTAEQSQLEAVKSVAGMMAASARTAPKAMGIDATETLVVDGSDLDVIATAMERFAEGRSPAMAASLQRDAGNVRKAGAVVLIGVSGMPKSVQRPLNCGACGFKGCEEMSRVTRGGGVYSGPTCVFQSLDLGIAIGSAIRVASAMGIDNRIMYTVGAAAKQAGFLSSDVVIGIPLSTTGKNPFFDRPALK